jgi:hypothetical protein
VLARDSNAEVAGPSEWRESVREVPAKAPGELGKPRITNDKELRVRSISPASASAPIPAWVGLGG